MMILSREEKTRARTTYLVRARLDDGGDLGGLHDSLLSDGLTGESGRGRGDGHNVRVLRSEK